MDTCIDVSKFFCSNIYILFVSQFLRITFFRVYFIEWNRSKEINVLED